MEASSSVAEKAPLLPSRRDFRPLSQDEAKPVTVQCCCVESSRLGRVPIIRTLFKKNTEKVLCNAG